jgi:hypothetical protein
MPNTTQAFQLNSNTAKLIRPKSSSFETLLALLFFFIVTVIFMRPVVFNFFSQVSGTGDTYEYVWRLWWFKHTLIDTGQSPWVVPFVYYPQGYQLAYSEVTPINTIFGLPFTIAWGEFSAHNALLFLAVWLTGFHTFLLARELTGSGWAGLMAGVLFGFSPYRRGQYFHLNQMSIQWFPLIFLFLERFLRTGRQRYALVGGVAFGLNAWASWYLGLAAGVLSLVWLASRAWPWWTYLRRQGIWLGGVIFSVVAVGLMAPFWPPYLAVVADPATHPPLENVNFWSASPTDYLIPNPFHPLWGRWLEEKLIPLAVLVDKDSPTQADFETGRFFPNSGLNIATEFLVAPGLISLLFAFYGLRWSDSHLTRPWLYLVLVSFILSLGPTLHLAGRQLVIPAPSYLTDAFNQFMNGLSIHSWQREPFAIGRENGLVVPLPALLLRWFAPGIGNVRTWARFGQFAIFGTAILAAYGAAAWYRREIARPWRKPKQRSANFSMPRTWPWLVVLGLALFELWWNPMPTHVPVTERPVDRWLAQQAGQQPLIQYPLDSSFNGSEFIYTRAHGKPIVHGYGTFFGFIFGRHNPELLTFPSAESLVSLERRQVRYVLVETQGPGSADAPKLLKQIAQVSCLHPATVQGSIHVFELINCSKGEAK